MNVFKLIQLLEEALQVYEELKSSGLLDELGAAVAKVEGDEKIQAFIKDLESFVENKK